MSEISLKEAISEVSRLVSDIGNICRCGIIIKIEGFASLGRTEPIKIELEGNIIPSDLRKIIELVEQRGLKVTAITGREYAIILECSPL